ncbi:MAG: peptidogalycan biosysnthesis protein [Chitinophagales bacterium]
MQDRFQPLEDGYSIQIFESITLIDSKKWNSINENIPFYQTHDFLSKIESIQQDITFRYVLVQQEDRVIAALYVQMLDFSFKNLVNYGGEISNGIKGKFKKYIAQKNTKLLNLGNVFFTGDKGVICQYEEMVIPFIPKIFKAIHSSFSEKKPKAFLVANIYLQDEDKCIDFCNSSFHPFNTEPDMFMNVNNNWKSFDDYLNALSSKYRVRAKKVLNTSAEIIPKEFSVEDIKREKESLVKLYNNVVNHVAFNMATLNINFFEEMKLLYDDKCTVLGYYLNDELVSFACLFHVDIATLHVHYIGLNYEVNKECKLYNRMLLDFVKFAIMKEKSNIHFGRTATEIKTTIGAEPRALHAYLKMSNSIVNNTLPYFLKRIKPAEFIARNPFK